MRFSRPLAALLFLLLAGPAPAQSWPTKPVKVVVPFAPGGTTDLLGRLAAQHLTSALGQPFLVENKPGAGTNIGADLVAKSPSDGTTLLVGTPSIAVNPALYATMPYDWKKDLQPVVMIGVVPNLLVVHPGVPAPSVKDLVALAKAQPGKLTFGSSAVGGAIHLSGELFKALAGVDMVHVPYKGSAPAVADLLAGRITLMFDNLPSSLPHARAGKLRALAVTSGARSPLLPEIPTVIEAGLPGFEVVSWNALFFPAGTPREYGTRVRTEISRLMSQPDVRARLQEQGIVPGGGPTEELAAFVAAEADKWQPLARKAGIKAD